MVVYHGFKNLILGHIYLVLIVLSSVIFCELNDPENGSVIKYTHVLFDWDQVPNAVSYNLQASTNLFSFQNGIILDISNDRTVYIDTENFNWNSVYYWRIRPIYIDGDLGEWSDISTFSIALSIN